MHGQNPHNNDTKPSAENQATEGSDSTEGTEPDNTEPEINTIPVDIETIGGVVIVGKIGFDEKGWHIIPEQPLNITYTYFLDNPSVFPAQTRISMLEPKDDGVDKAVYLGQTVTVAGTFRFMRNDFETVYLIPYTITMGKLQMVAMVTPILRHRKARLNCMTAPNHYLSIWKRIFWTASTFTMRLCFLRNPCSLWAMILQHFIVIL